MIFQMVMRCVSMVLLLVALSYHLDSEELWMNDEFIVTGTYAGFAVVLFGMMLAMGIGSRMDPRIESIFLFFGIAMLLLTSGLAYRKFIVNSSKVAKEDSMGFTWGVNLLLSQGLIAIIATVVMVIDLVILFTFS